MIYKQVLFKTFLNKPEHIFVNSLGVSSISI